MTSRRTYCALCWLWKVLITVIVITGIPHSNPHISRSHMYYFFSLFLSIALMAWRWPVKDRNMWLFLNKRQVVVLDGILKHLVRKLLETQRVDLVKINARSCLQCELLPCRAEERHRTSALMKWHANVTSYVKVKTIRSWCTGLKWTTEEIGVLVVEIVCPLFRDAAGFQA